MGHKSSGSWDDVTSLGRNEIVFEGRHKAYGAFYVRQRYNYALLMGLLLTLSTIIVGTGTPMLIKKLFPGPGPVVNITPVDSVTVVIDNYTPPTPPKPKPPVPHPPVTNTPPPPQTTDLPPIITTDPNQVDSANTAKKQNDTRVGSTTVPGDAPVQPPTLPVDPGPSALPAQPVMWAPIMPKFNGDLADFLGKNVDFPTQQREMGNQGVVYASFVIEADGSVSNIKILRGIPGADKLSETTLEGLKKMPKWEPGQQNGHPVRVQLNIPVKFQLN